ncbi:MAG: ABC transporter permease, partial [Candidatus Solibacter sp.]
MRQWRENIGQDIRFAWRTALRSPGFVLSAAGTLALGIGATTTIFSILSGVLLRPLPFPAPERLVQVEQWDTRSTASVVYLADMEDWQRQSVAIESVASYWFTSKNLVDVPDPERIQTVSADRSLFRVLGVAPLAGRTFADNDEPEVAVLSASLWKRRFSGDTRAIGRKVSLDGRTLTIIGVMPESFQFPYRAARTEMWIPSRPSQRLSRTSRTNAAVARLKRGLTLEAAQQEMNAFSEQLAAAYPATTLGRRTRLIPLAESVGGKVRSALLTLLGAVGLLLLIACANVANLLLARAA